MENEIGVGELFFLNFFSNFQFHISKKDKNKCPKWKNEIENWQKKFEKKVLLHKERNVREKYYLLCRDLL